MALQGWDGGWRMPQGPFTTVLAWICVLFAAFLILTLVIPAGLIGWVALGLTFVFIKFVFADSWGAIGNTFGVFGHIVADGLSKINFNSILRFIGYFFLGCFALGVVVSIAKIAGWWLLLVPVIVIACMMGDVGLKLIVMPIAVLATIFFGVLLIGWILTHLGWGVFIFLILVAIFIVGAFV